MGYTPGMPLIGQRVIALTNEQSPPMVATIIGFDDFGKPKQERIPLILTDDGRELLCMGLLLPYTEELLTMANALPPGRAWWAFRDAFWFRSDLNRAMEPTPGGWYTEPPPEPPDSTTGREKLWQTILRRAGLREVKS